MAILQVVALGILQGLTEFLPVSSDGHLAVGQRLLGLAEPSLLLTVVLHLGTLAVVAWVFRADLALLSRAARRLARAARRGRLGACLADDDEARLLAMIGVASLPTAAIGLALRESVERWTRSPSVTGVGFLLSAAALWATRRGGPRAALITPGRLAPEVRALGVRTALIVGVAQGLAVAPGVSRSGLTIAAGLLLGLPGALAARFSFLLSIPSVGGALLLEARHLSASPVLGLGLVGAAVAGVTGLAALRWLLWIVNRGAVHRFALYLVPVGAATLAWGLLGGG